MRFAGKVAMIVGAGSGLGAAVAAEFAREGARLVLVDRDEGGLHRQAVRAFGATLICADATEPASAEKAVEAAGAVDILVHTAGVDPLSATDVPGTSLKDWQSILSVNLTSAFLFARAVLPGMIAAGGGSILHFENGRFRVGPDSAGANPGPKAYRRGGPLTDGTTWLSARPAALRLRSTG